MKKEIAFVILLLVIVKIGNGQNSILINDNEWIINHYQGRCYHDTIIHAIFLYIEPNQQLKKYQNDTSFVVVEVMAVNKSPIDIYIHGENNKMKVPVIREKYIADTARLKNSDFIWSAMPMKLDRSLAFEMEDYSMNPHKNLWDREKEDSLIKIPKDKRKKVFVTIPKREGDYRIEVVVEFNKEMYAYGCEGQKVAWPQFRTIESNKIEIKKKKE